MPAQRHSLPLNERLSVTIAEAGAATGWSRALIYLDVKSGALESYTIGNRRFIVLASIHRRIAERLQDGGGVPQEISNLKSAAGRKGRASQLATGVGRSPRVSLDSGK